jgi:subtilisin family serine protease
MARIHAFLKLDPRRALEQEAFLQSRVTVLRSAGGQYWVEMEDAQVDTFISQGFAVNTDATALQLELGPLVYRPAAETPSVPDNLRASAPADGEAAYWIVQFVAPMDMEWLDALAELDAPQMHLLSDSAAVFQMTSAAADTVRAMPMVASVALFHPLYAVSLELAGLEEAVDAAGAAAISLQSPPPHEGGNIRVETFDGVDAGELASAIEATGAEILAQDEDLLVVNAQAGQLEQILHIPGILHISPVKEHFLANHNAGVIIGANQVRNIGTVDFLVNLTGVGEIGAVVDSGFDVGNLAGGTPPATGVFTPFHPDLASAMRLLRNSNTPDNAALNVPDNSPHGTHVAGTVAGDGTNSGGSTRGVAPGAALIGLGPLPNNVRVPFTFAANNGARVINNSWGSSFNVGVNNNRYTNTESRPVDLWCFENPDVLICFAAGNNEEDLLAGGDGVLDARRLGLEATAKNALTVGASENLRNDGGARDSYRTTFGNFWPHASFNATAGGANASFAMSDNADEVVLFSDRGQVRTSTHVNTRRVKPDIVAPGTNVLSLRSQWVAQPPPLPAPAPPPAPPPNGIADPFYFLNSNSMLPAGLNRNLYQILSGTSMATPQVTGAALLVRQYYRTRFAQMRRPLLLQGVPHPAAPLPAFEDNPVIATHADGLVCVWITPVALGGTKNLVGMRLNRRLQPVDAAPVALQNDVGDHPAPKIVTVGERTYLLHRHGDNKMRLSCYDRALQLVTTFGTNGVVTLSPDARADDAVYPDLIAVNTHLACAFPTGADGYFFQRFNVNDGTAADPAAISFLFNLNTSSHHSLAWNGNRYTVAGVAHPGNYLLQTRQLTTAGALRPGPTTIVDQAQEIREPCLLWLAASNRFALAWWDARNTADGEVWFQFLDPDGAAIDSAHRVIGVPAGATLRRLRLEAHPDSGFALFFEDNSQNGHFDQYFTFLDTNGEVDERIPLDPETGRRVMRLSDTPDDVNGFGVFTDDQGFVVLYYSPDEINSDQSAVYALAITSSGAFQAHEDSSTPMLRSGNYVAVDALDHNVTALDRVSAVWTGSHYYILRQSPDNLFHRLEWLRLNADGAEDRSYGIGGTLLMPIQFLISGAELLWTRNDRIVTALNDLIFGITVHLFDAQGAPVASFGTAGAAALQDTVPLHDRITPQLGFVAQPTQRIIVAYATVQGGNLQLRQQRLNTSGNRIGTAANLAAADGVAPHNWFRFVNSANRSIAIYHRVNGAVTRVHCRRFRADGTADGAERNISAAVGEGINGVIAERPTIINSNRREYGAAWQYRANDAADWEIHFSRLGTNGTPLANPPPPAPARPVSDVTVISAATPGWVAGRQAVEPQLVSTFTHEPWTNPPSPLPAGTALPRWSPSYGLAWIGEESTGERQLYFTVLDENGSRLSVPQPPPAAPGAALLAPVQIGITRISSGDVRVQDFKLVWNGKVFFITWTEEAAGRLHHRYTALNRHGDRNAYALPSAALLRATLVGGATNITPASLPDLTTGYGWGRLNLRQALSPAPPVTLHVRDDCAIGPGRTVSYTFTLPPGTALLRVTLNWTDPPGPRLVNRLHLRVLAPTPAGPGLLPEYRGNVWDTTAGRTHLSRPIPDPPTAADNHENIQTYKQVVLENPPAGIYTVEVFAEAFPADAFNQQNLQAFALVFAGSGPEVRFRQTVAEVTGAPVY